MSMPRRTMEKAIPQETSVFATPKEAARFLRIGLSTVYDSLDRGELPEARVGRCRRIPWAALHRMAEPGSLLPPPEGPDAA
jgi:excisionase family DNA binding protein